MRTNAVGDSADDGEAAEVLGNFEVEGGSGRRPDPGAVEQERPDATSFFISYSREDEDYVLGLAAHLRASGLPVWFDRDMAWGVRFPQDIRERLTRSLAIIVVMSPGAERSPWVEREILEGQRNDREFLPILLRGGPLFLLASSNYFDARLGDLPGERELRQLRAMLGQSVVGSGGAASLVLPAPIRRAPVAPVSSDTSLRTLSSLLRDGELEHADILTTSLLLEAVDRLDTGWMRRVDGEKLPFELLASIDAVWSGVSPRGQGFSTQLVLYRGPVDWIRPGSSGDFSALALALGWKGSVGSRAPRYGQYGDLDRSPASFRPCGTPA